MASPLGFKARVGSLIHPGATPADLFHITEIFVLKEGRSKFQKIISVRNITQQKYLWDGE